MKTLIIIPTYNELENLRPLLQEIFSYAPETDVLIVDDNSPDGTAQIVRKMPATNSRPHLLVGKRQGLGRAYVRGFQHGLKKLRPFAVVMMDADFSHDPAEVVAMSQKLDGADVVIGSRYVAGGAIENWHWKRRMLSKWLRSEKVRDVGFDLIERARSLVDQVNRVAKTNLPRDRHLRRRGRELFIES